MTKDEARGHIEYLLKYWSAAVDFERGGINYMMDNYGGGPIFQDKKCLIMHSRQLYDFCVGTEFQVEGAENIAHHLYNTLDQVFPKCNELYKSYNFSENAFESKLVSAYDLYFAVMGLARYAKTFKSREAYERSKSLFLAVNSFFDEENFTGLGTWTNFDTEKKQYSLKSGNTYLHRLEALNNLALALKEFPNPEAGEMSWLKSEVYKIYGLFESNIFLKNLSTTIEGFDDQMRMSKEQEYGYVTNAHPLEWFGFLLEASWLLEEDFPILSQDGRNIVEASFERSKTDSGCFGNNFYLKEMKTIYVSSFWSQSEAILAFFYAHKFYNDQKYFDWASLMFDFYREKYIDSEFGGIFSDVSETGIVVSRSKGYNMKCDYHQVRMCEKILNWNLL